MDDTDPLLDTITDIVPTILDTMLVFEAVQRQLAPDRYRKLAARLAPAGGRLTAAGTRFRAATFPPHMVEFEEHLEGVLTYLERGLSSFAEGAESPRGLGQIMRAMRAHCRAQEFLYPLAAILTPVSQYFLEQGSTSDKELLRQLAEGMRTRGSGIHTAENDRGQRGGFSLYVPENLDGTAGVPLVVALHGGSGHGADFLWSWLREARTRGFVLLAPTAQGDTWSLTGADDDAGPLDAMVDYVCREWHIDHRRLLLTGMSDGATYALLNGLRENSPFTHIAPLSGVLHPENLVNGNIARARGKPIYLVHGTMDWMFPIERAYAAREQLRAVGAELVFRELPDLSHNYARTENPAILDWFLDEARR